MNFFDAKLTKEGDNYFVHIEGASFKVDSKKTEILKEKGIENKDIILGVRPDHIKLSDGQEGIKAKLKVKEMMGAEMHLHLERGEYKDIIAIVPTSSLSADQKESLKEDKEVSFAFEGKFMHLFDKETEENLIY